MVYQCAVTVAFKDHTFILSLHIHKCTDNTDPVSLAISCHHACTTTELTVE